MALAAGEFVRIAPHVIRLQADGFQEIDDTLLQLPPGFRQLVDDQGLADDRTDIHARIERGIRVLEDDLDVAAQQAKLVRRQLPAILAFKMDVARGRLDQAKHAASGGRFAAAGFADQPQGLAAVDVKVHAVDRVDAVGVAPEQAALERKFLGQVRDPEQRLTHWTTVASAWIQATLWSGSSSRKAGCATRHSSVANLQRAAKRQPGGGAISFGTVPAMVASRVLRIAAISRRGIERIRPCV